MFNMEERCLSPCLAMMEKTSKEEHPRKLKKTQHQYTCIKTEVTSHSYVGSPSAMGFSPSDRLSVNDSLDTALPSTMAPAATVFNAHRTPSQPKSKDIVPNAPPCIQKKNLVGSNTKIGDDESYGNDEHMLNDFMRLHPMLRCAQLLTPYCQRKFTHIAWSATQHGSDLVHHAAAHQRAVSES